MPNYKYLFLDRDGVINIRLPGRYVERPSQFELIKGTLEALILLRKKFDRIFIVTNQQGLGKGIMTVEALARVHQKMLHQFSGVGVEIDAIHFSPDLRAAPKSTRKPKPDMALQIRRDFPEVDFSRSIMVGDSISDMLFGKRLNMKTILIKSNPEEVKQSSRLLVDASYDSLFEFSKTV